MRVNLLSKKLSLLLHLRAVPLIVQLSLLFSLSLLFGI